MTIDPRVSKSLVRFAAVAVVAVGASACSSVPHWADPTAWIGDSDQTATSDEGNPNAQTPDLASIPDKPAAPSTADERRQVAESLEADRTSVQYSADALRGGTEPSAAPPPDAPPEAAQTAAPSAANSPAQTADADQPAAYADAAPAAAAPASAPQASASAANPATTQGAAAASAPEPAAQVASTAPTADTSAASAPTSDDQLGFQPSKAPALDPSVANFVPKSVLERYKQTTGSSSGSPAFTPPAPPKPDAKQTSSSIDPPTDEHAARQASTADDAPAGSSKSAMVTPAAYTPDRQSAPQAVVFFPHDSAALSSQAKSQILAAAQAFRSRASGGFVRVVGHSSSRTAEMPMARHLEVVFERSQNFATVVAHELVRDGVPADKVLIEAVGDAQPVYYESMPQGEAGNRRAEIFL